MGHLYLRLSAVALSLTFLASVATAASTSLNVVERAMTDVVSDTGAKDDSAGDILTFANEIYDETNATKTGDDNGFCIRTVAGKAWECVATVTLADGQLTVEGPFLDGKDSAWAVTGGTGKYKSMRGEMQLHARDAKGSEYDFKFNLTE
ncbi:MAG TPA: allene oxide cyclase family protein [Aestuariivirga sp.]|nr:allene oxide cyclase family protein [Aestuariivirga sp.]